MAKMSGLEKLAREICWLGFADPKNAGCTKTEYWRRIDPNAKRDYLDDARRFCSLYRRMNGTARRLLETE